MTGDLETDDVARPGWRRVVALALHEVRPVDAGCGHVDEDLARGGHRVVDLRQPEGVGTTGFVDDDGTHGFSLPRAVT